MAIRKEDEELRRSSIPGMNYVRSEIDDIRRAPTAGRAVGEAMRSAIAAPISVPVAAAMDIYGSKPVQAAGRFAADVGRGLAGSPSSGRQPQRISPSQPQAAAPPVAPSAPVSASAGDASQLRRVEVPTGPNVISVSDGRKVFMDPATNKPRSVDSAGMDVTGSARPRAAQSQMQPDPGELRRKQLPSRLTMGAELLPGRALPESAPQQEEIRRVSDIPLPVSVGDFLAYRQQVKAGMFDAEMQSKEMDRKAAGDRSAAELALQAAESGRRYGTEQQRIGIERQRAGLEERQLSGAEEARRAAESREGRKEVAETERQRSVMAALQEAENQDSSIAQKLAAMNRARVLSGAAPEIPKQQQSTGMTDAEVSSGLNSFRQQFVESGGAEADFERTLRQQNPPLWKAAYGREISPEEDARKRINTIRSLPQNTLAKLAKSRGITIKQLLEEEEARAGGRQ